MVSERVEVVIYKVQGLRGLMTLLVLPSSEMEIYIHHELLTKKIEFGQMIV